MRKRLGISLVLLSIPCLAATFMPCGRGENPAGFERFHTQGEPYSVAECAGFDAKRHFEELRMDLEMDSLESIKLGHLGKVAKAALEAGLYDEAKSYAEQALAVSAEDRIKKHPMSKNAIGDATFLGHLVLGRLALLHDDVEEAEKHLLLSAEIQNGRVTFWGPNMTLARELLRRNRSKSVLQFLEAAKLFWRVDCAGPETADKWAAEIREGKMPDFGANLIYY